MILKNNFKLFYWFGLIFFYTGFSSFGQVKDYASLVNPFIGTAGHGHTYPGVSAPFGMVQLSPDTRLSGWDGCSGYHYSDSVIYGFSHTHLSGTGCSDYGDILFMPVSGKPVFLNTQYCSTFSHSKETATAGYYSVFLEKPHVKVELTAGARAGLHKYVYSDSLNAGIVIDLEHRDKVLESSIEYVNEYEVRGMRRSKAWADDQVVYFCARFSLPIAKYIFIDGDSASADGNASKLRSGLRVKAFLNFNLDSTKTLLVKVAISAVSTDGAAKNLDAEIPGWDFNSVRENARKLWNIELGKLDAEGGSPRQDTIFYTALYHAMLSPNLYMDVDGQYRGTDKKVHKADGFNYYTVFSLWDTYRAEHPLLSIIDRKRTGDFINTFLAQYQQGGLLPVWELSENETFCMIGYHSVPVIVDAYMKGIHSFDTVLALEAMKNSADAFRSGLADYKKNGFISAENESESVSKTLEYAYDDWCIAVMAQKMGRTEDYKKYIRRAQSYKNLYDPATGFMRARQNGMWYEPFNPGEVNFNYTEANAFQYGFYVPQDITGLINLMGGRNKAIEKLDAVFETEQKLSGREQPDITGLIGQYAQGNEPSHHMAYMYDYLGQPWKTQKLIDRITKTMYTNQTDGLIGNEDCGQMSAWFVMSAMGFYPVCPGSSQYAIGKPMFPKMTIHLENGKDFIIIADSLSYLNTFIYKAWLNDSIYNNSFLNHSDIAEGGKMVFKMRFNSNSDWASRTIECPSTTILDCPIVPAPWIDAKGKTFSTEQLVAIKALTTDTEIYFTTDGKEPDISSKRYSAPFTIAETTTIKAIAFKRSIGKSAVITSHFIKTPKGRSIRLKSKYSPQYTAGGPEGLIDYQRGGPDFRTGNWQGYWGDDFEAVVNLGSEKKISKISAGFLQDVKSWIWMPAEVKFYVSDDGHSFKLVKEIKNNISDKDYTVVVKEFETQADTRARYVKIEAKNYGIIPQWHDGAGGKAWIFIDEITVE
ncbi:MAG: GH92 family glycosyl hydrolase [Bacteroidota bacterium]